ncbi:hypothetical protein BDF20DRAFT_486474 [Mycotypha africana]|uniref:uncharacterized protein n=1 Tax=Mycotypha africana TaxID=64632 RepID=UPI00230076AA|nr:uncharacterized protein BDF20DRAFT_486474 [Mycotypha africana]KAI8979203.1 hypothetical protein BDF20DRAFT_486474 [Mycotypha africana]
MFQPPVKQLQSSLRNVFTNAQEYFADVYIEYTTEKANQPRKTIWAHKAMLLVRVPTIFQKQYMPELQEKHGLRNDMKPSMTQLNAITCIIPYQLCKALFLYWYTGDMLSEEVERELLVLEKALNTDLGINTTDQRKEQLEYGLQRLLDEAILTDANISIHDSQLQQSDNNNIFAIHRFMLAGQAKYFYSVFCSNFSKTATSTFYLPADIFSEALLKIIITYFYTEKIILPSPPATVIIHSQRTQQQLNEKKYELRLLQKALLAADFLNLQDTLGKTLLSKMAIICHQFCCTCSECAALLPSMLLFFGVKHQNYMPQLNDKLIQLYSDPVDSLAPLWSQKPFAILILSLVNHSVSETTTAKIKINEDRNEESSLEDLSSIFIRQKISDDKQEELVHEIETRTLSNITKQNAIRALHSLYLCLSQLRGADPLSTWSQAVLKMLNSLLLSTVVLVADNFDYYCVEYPVLLSCVDGIGFGFSVDFLEFVLSHVLKEGINDKNAVILYQGIIRDLGGRQELIKNIAVDGVLCEARSKCVQYLSKRWPTIKAEGGFNHMDKEILKKIAEDIDVSIRSLTKPAENDFSSIFNFKPKKLLSSSVDNSTKLPLNPPLPKGDASLPSSTSHGKDIARGPFPSLKRLSLGATPNSTTTASCSEDLPIAATRARSLSESTVFRPEESVILNEDIKPKVKKSTAPEIEAPWLADPHNKNRQGSISSLSDALLPLEGTSGTIGDTVGKAPRATKLRFALPDTPTRIKASQYGTSSQLRKQNSDSSSKYKNKNKKKRAKSPSNGRWSLVGGYSSGTTSDSSDDEVSNPKPAIGQKVELLRRPLPTLGTIKYIGPVDFAKGIWVGVELESRVGNNDGSIEGKRYFQTFPQRGVFVKIDDFKVISNNHRIADKK